MDKFEGDNDKKSWASFQERIAKAPEQVLRYSRNVKAKPLWPMSSGRPSNADIPKCNYCDGPRCFEFQIGELVGIAVGMTVLLNVFVAGCTFMNFPRNMECLECNEKRPKTQLTGGEWDCPQCTFFNYGKNVACLRCDCRRPREASGSAGPRFGFEYNNRNKADISNIRTTYMEQRMGNVQYQGTLGNTSIPEQINIQSIDGLDPGKSSVTSINQNLDRTLGRASEGSKSEQV